MEGNAGSSPAMSIIDMHGIARKSSSMDTLGFEPRAFRMRSGCDTTTPCAFTDTVYLHMNLDHYMTMNFRPPVLNYSRLKEVKNLVRELRVLPASSLADAGVRDEREMGSRTVRLEATIYGLEVQRLVRGLELLVFPTRSNR